MSVICEILHLWNINKQIDGYLVVLLAGPISHTSTRCMDFVEIFNIILDLSITCFSHFSGCWASFMFIVITLSWNAITCFLESSWVWDRFLLFASCKSLKLTKTLKCVFFSPNFYPESRFSILQLVWNRSNRDSPWEWRNMHHRMLDAVALLPIRTELPYRENLHTFCAKE